MIKGFVIGFVLAVVILASGFYCYFAFRHGTGRHWRSPMPFEKKLANKALNAHIEKQHVVQSPVAADEPNFLAGADVYKQHCAACHGMPGQPATHRLRSNHVPEANPIVPGYGRDR